MKVITKNYKKIDCVLFYDEIEMLKFRLTELDEHVDYFIIMECDVDFKGNSKKLVFEDNKEQFKAWENKIIHIPTRNISKNLVESICDSTNFTNILPFQSPNLTERDIVYCQTHDLHKILLSINLSPEDIVLFSDIDEIPDFLNFNSVIDNLNFEPVILTQKNFIWSTEYYDPNPYFGTCCFQFSSLLGFPNKIYQKYFSKKNRLIDKNASCENGFHFAHFYDLDRTIKKLKLLSNSTDVEETVTNGFYNLISIFDYDYQKPQGLVEYTGLLPKHHSLLPSQKIGRDYSKKHTILFNSEKESTETVSVINFTFNLSLPPHDTRFNILLPTSKYYDVLINDNTLENFQKMYGANEIKKVLQSFYPLGKDLFVFVNGDKSVEYSWSELKDEFIYDKIKDIL